MKPHAPALSLGAGVQSSVLLLMACSGELEERGWANPEVVVFADTQDEPDDVMEWLPLLRMEAHRAGIPLVEATHGDLRQDLLDVAAGTRKRAANPPLFVRDPETGKPGMITRQCTQDYKIRVVRQELRKRGYGPKRPAVTYMGLTTDEIQRVKPSNRKWNPVCWPLIDMGMSRTDCKQWLADHGYPQAPKSACRICPMRSDAAWREMKVNRPDDFEIAVSFERALHAGNGLRLKGTPYLHKSCVPLDQVDFRNAEDHGQLQLCETGGCWT